LNGKKETIHLVGAYGNPTRDPRKHVISLFYLCEVSNPSQLKASDDAAEAGWFDLDDMISDTTSQIGFDHQKLMRDLKDALKSKKT